MTMGGSAEKDKRRITTGNVGESLAAEHLQRKGYEIVVRNYRCLYGEVDIIARDGDTLVFVEVKSRKSDMFGTPQEAVGREKQKKISRISVHYLQQNRLEACKARFDVIAVRIFPEGIRVEHIQNAFSLLL